MGRLLRLAGWIRHHASVSIALTLAFTCVVVGFATGFWLLFRLAYVVAFAIPRPGERTIDIVTPYPKRMPVGPQETWTPQ